MIKKEELRNEILKIGADLCGFAPNERFENAPIGFRPTDIYKECKTVVVIAKKVPHGSLFSKSCVPYSHVNDLITREVDFLTMEIARLFEKLEITCVPIPSDDPYEYWIPAQKYGRAILSLKHAGYNAGLGVLGKNTLLINEKFGNMIQLGAVLINYRIEGDPIAQYQACIEGCQICLKNCPQGALDEFSVNQKLCRPLSNQNTQKGYVLKKCNLCRKLCPNVLGIKSLVKVNR